MSASSTAGVAHAGNFNPEPTDDKTKHEKDHKKEDEQWASKGAALKKALNEVAAASPACSVHNPQDKNDLGSVDGAANDPLSCLRTSDTAFWCAHHCYTFNMKKIEHAEQDRDHSRNLCNRAAGQLEEADKARLKALEDASKVSDRGCDFSQELSTTTCFSDKTATLESVLRTASTRLTSAATLAELKACRDTLEEALSVGEGIVSTMSDFICRIDGMEEDLNEATESSKRVEQAQKHLHNVQQALHQSELHWENCLGEVALAEDRLSEVRSRLLWNGHLPSEHLLSIFKLAGEAGRRCLASVCHDFSAAVRTGRANGHFRHKVLVVLCDQPRSTTEGHTIGHTFSLTPNESFDHSLTHNPILSCHSRSKYAVVYHNNCVYVLGGRLPNDRASGKGPNITATCCVFNAEKSLQWQPIRPMLHARENFQAAMLQGKIVVFGGPERGLIGAGPRACEVYDPETDTWAAVENLSSVREQHGVAVLGNTMYLIGGLLHRQFARSVDMFNIETGHWTPAHPMTSRRANSVTAIFNNRIVVIGGRNNTHLLNSCEAYTPATNTWTQMAPLHTTRFNAGAAVVAGRLFVCGGRGLNNCVHASVEEYMPATDSWVLAEPMSLPRASQFHKPAVCCEKIVSVLLNDSLLVLGGDPRSTGHNKENPVGELLNLETGTWQKSTELSVLNGMRIYEATIISSAM